MKTFICTAAAAVLGLLALPAAMAQAPEPTPPLRAVSCPGGSHALNRTVRLGLQFVQDNEIVLMCGANDWIANRIVSVRLRRAPFEMRVPLETWNPELLNAPLLVALSDEPDFAKLVELEAPLSMTPFFGWGTTFAITDYGDGTLITSRHGPNPPPEEYPRQYEFYGHHDISGGRFNASGPGYRGVFVSRIERHSAYDQDLMRGDAPVTMVFYLDRARGDRPRMQTADGAEDVLDLYEYEVLTVTFVDR